MVGIKRAAEIRRKHGLPDRTVPARYVSDYRHFDGISEPCAVEEFLYGTP
jgi:hypothetical protein